MQTGENNALTGSMTIRLPKAERWRLRDGGTDDWAPVQHEKKPGPSLRTDSPSDKAQVGGQEPPIGFG